MSKLVVRALKLALAKQKELHKKRFDLLRSEGLTEENAGRIKALVKSIPKEKKSKDPLEYNPDMKHFTGSIKGQKIEEPMKEKDLYTHLTGKGVSDRDATELIVRLKAPYENKEKIDKLLKTAQKFGDMAKKQSADRKRAKGKFVPLTDKQRERQEKYHKIRKQHEGNAKKLGHDPKHPLWSAPTDPLDSIRKVMATKPKNESINEGLAASLASHPMGRKMASRVLSASRPNSKSGAIVKFASKIPAARRLSGRVLSASKGIKSAVPKVQPQKTTQQSSLQKPVVRSGPPVRSGSSIVQAYASKGQTLDRSVNRPSTTPVVSTPDYAAAKAQKIKSLKKKAKVGTFRTIAGAVASYGVTRTLGRAFGPIGGIVGAHLGMKLAKKIKGQ